MSARVALVEESTSRSHVTTGRRVAVGAQESRTHTSDEAGNGGREGGQPMGK